MRFRLLRHRFDVEHLMTCASTNLDKYVKQQNGQYSGQIFVFVAAFTQVERCLLVLLSLSSVRDLNPRCCSLQYHCDVYCLPLDGNFDTDIKTKLLSKQYVG